MAKATKQTKKFQHKHLKHTLDLRKKAQKQNQKIASRKKSGNKNHNDDKKGKEVFNDMSVDAFFENGFEVPKEKKSKKPQQAEEESGSEESNDEEQQDEEMQNGEDDENSSSEDEDPEAVEEDMKNLADKDPEFYKYLQENDKGLLDFEGVNPLDAMSDDDEEEEEEEEEDQDEGSEHEKNVNDDVEEDTSKSVSQTAITLALVKKWQKELSSKPSPKLIRQLCIAFKAAINVNDADSGNYKYVVTDPKAFNELMMVVLKQLPDAIQSLVPYKVGHSGVRNIPQKNPHTSQISSILKSHAGSFITLLNDINNTETAALVLFSLQELFPFYISFRRLLKELLSSVVNIWSSTNQVEVQIATFAFLNNISKEFQKSILDTVLKLVYTTFLKNCRKTNQYTMPLFNFCKNSAAELFCIDETVSYQIGFEYVRQAAIHLRNSINATSNAKEGFKTIYNWQYCHSLDFWSRIVSQQCNPERELVNHKNKESPSRQLIYPLVQVTLGTIRLIPTAQFFPLRFYLIRSLIRLSQSTGVFIPIFPLVSEILTSTAITKQPKRTNLPVFDFENNIKVNQQYLGSKIFQDGACEQFIELSYEFFVLHSKSIAFPELVTPAIISLRRFMKGSKNIKFNKQLQQLVEKLNDNSKFISAKRSKVEYGPSNKSEVQMFLNDFEWTKTPLGQYVVIQRQAKEEKLRLLREAEEEEQELIKKQQAKEENQEQESDASEADLGELDSDNDDVDE